MNEMIPMRDRILAATEEMLVEDGMQTSMSRIAARAGVAIGSLYNYFESKDVLIRAVYGRLAQQIIAAHLADDASGLSPLGRLERYVEVYVDFFWSDAQRAILFEYLSNVPLIPSDEMAQKFDAATQHILSILSDLADTGALKHADCAIAGAFIGGAIRNTLKWHRALAKQLTREDRTQIMEMCLRAVLEDPGLAKGR